MAIKSTIYKIDLQVSDMDRHYYQQHNLTLAKHPSETDERVMVRLLAFALYANESLIFGKGLSDEEEPDLWQKDLTGAIDLWIDVGLPSERDIRKAAGRSKQVVVVPEEEEGGEPAVTGVDALFAAISRSKSAAYRVILKADVGGSLEALRETLELITSDKVLLEILQSDVGQITKNDIKMANTSGADVIGFNVKMENGVMGDAKHQDVKVFQNSIIYEIIDLVKDNMAELLEPELVEKKTGRAEIRQVFKVSKGRTVAGSMIMEGSIIRNKGARLVRKGKVLAEGKIETLKRFKDDATEVKAGFECGIRLDSFDEYEEGDMIETFEVEKIRPSL